jgi:hypothetical protein
LKLNVTSRRKLRLTKRITEFFDRKLELSMSLTTESMEHTMNRLSKTSLIVSFSAFLTLGLLVSCAQPLPHPMDMSVALQNAKTRADHEALARHYEQTANEMRQKAEEHQKILNDFFAHHYLYGKLDQYGYQAHCENLIRIYKEAAASNLEMAKLHRKMG